MKIACNGSCSNLRREASWEREKLDATLGGAGLEGTGVGAETTVSNAGGGALAIAAGASEGADEE